MKKVNSDFLIFLRLMSKKGFFEILLYIESNPDVRYNEVMRNAIDKRIVKSEATITKILNALTDLGLLARKVKYMRPIRTTYSVTAKGSRVIKLLKDIDRTIR